MLDQETKINGILFARRALYRSSTPVISYNLKKILSFILLGLTLSSCKLAKERPEIAEVLFKLFNNKLYDEFDTAAYKPIFQAKFAAERSKFLHQKGVTSFYERNEHLPVLTTRFYVSGGLDSLKHYLENSTAEGFNKEIYNTSKFQKSLQLLDSHKFKSIYDVYEVVAELEISAAYAINKYTSFMKFGSINPKYFIDRYFIPVKRIDSAGMDSILSTDDLAVVLQQSQQRAKPYLLMKKALARYRDSLGTDDHATIKALKLNMERMRWQLPRQTVERVVVNIPDFTLTWFKEDDTLAHMKVCLGEKRESDYYAKFKVYRQSGNLDDKPKNHETPQMFSSFNAIQVNPIWNIPVSIAQSEIYWMARKDRYYLTNNNIKVYQKGKIVDDPDTIVWSNYSRDNLPFTFKQSSGRGNALGKFKFVFDNSANIYLHDTNNKSGFNLANRAISHGCVRVQEPLKFAELMVRDKYQYDNLRMEVNLPPVDSNRRETFAKKIAKRRDTLTAFKLKPSWFAPRKDITVFLAYYTAWVDGNGKVQLRPDVYGYDPLLWEGLKKYM